MIVQDVQDVPPIFTLAPPLTKINNTIQPVCKANKIMTHSLSSMTMHCYENE